MNRETLPPAYRRRDLGLERAFRRTLSATRANLMGEQDEAPDRPAVAAAANPVGRQVRPLRRW